MRAAKLIESESHVSFLMPRPASFRLSAICIASGQKLGGSLGTSLYIDTSYACIYIILIQQLYKLQMVILIF